MTGYFLALKGACARLTKVAAAEAQAKAGIYGAQAQALLLLSQLDVCRISELARHLDLGKPAATTLVNRMEKAGLLYRKPDRNDARASILATTPKGREAVDEVKQMIAALDRRLASGFSERELAVISRFLVQATLLDHQ